MESVTKFKSFLEFDFFVLLLLRELSRLSRPQLSRPQLSRPELSRPQLSRPSDLSEEPRPETLDLYDDSGSIDLLLRDDDCRPRPLRDELDSWDGPADGPAAEEDNELADGPADGPADEPADGPADGPLRSA